MRDQVKAQLELKILGGELAPGARLPSVRALARRLKVHPNTISAVYQELEGAGHLVLKRGSGVFVRRGGPTAPQDARELDEMIRLALQMALGKGFSGPQIRSAVERWLAAAPPERIMVIDPSREMAELLVHELKQSFTVSIGSCALDDLARDPALLSGALALTLPYHLESVARLAPSASVEVVNLQVSDADRQAILALPPGAIVLVVSHSPTVLPFASVLLKSLRGEEILVEARPLSAAREWRRLIPAADVVFSDALAVEVVRRARPRRLREVRIIPETALSRLRDALTVVVPRTSARSPARRA